MGQGEWITFPLLPFYEQPWISDTDTWFCIRTPDRLDSLPALIYAIHSATRISPGLVEGVGFRVTEEELAMQEIIPGLDRLATHFPFINSRQRWQIFALALACFLLAMAVLTLFDLYWPSGALVGQFAILLGGQFLVAQIIWHRNRFRSRWGDAAYQRAVMRYGVTGLPIVLAAVANIPFLPGERILAGWLGAVAMVAGVYLLLLGLALWLRAALTFGMDNLAMVYVYYPQEGRIVQSSIYSVLRHPVYAAVIRVGIGLALLRGVPFALAFGLFMPLGMMLWLRLVEERELVERFGNGYLEYRRKVPAFWPGVKGWPQMVRFVVSGDRNETHDR